jgi:integrase
VPRAPTGSIYRSRGRWYARVVLDKPRAFVLPPDFDEAAAEARKEILAGVAVGLRRRPEIDVATGRKVLALLAGASGVDLPVVRKWAESIVRGERRPATSAEIVTLGEVADQWTSGDLHRRYPDRVTLKLSFASDVSRLRNHILDIEVEDGMRMRDLPIAAVTLDHGEHVLSVLPEALQVGTRRHVARLLTRLLNLAVYPLRLIAASPLPKGFVPPAGPRKALAWLYPDEDRTLLGSGNVPLGRRMLYGFLAREGCRIGEARRLELPEFDLARGVLTLDKNKTKDPRAWALTPGVPEALRIWCGLAGIERGLVFPVASEIDPSHAARVFREDLQAAGVLRPELFEDSPTRIAIREHDLRATFITISLANGKTERWIMDRTGHRTSAMIMRYARVARTASELDLGQLDRLDRAIPELLAVAAKSAGSPPRGRAGSGSGSVGREVTTAKVTAEMKQIGAAAPRSASPWEGSVSGPHDAEMSDERRESVEPTGATVVRPTSAGDDSPTIRHTTATNPRQALLLSAIEAMREAVVGGDLGLAQQAHEMAGRLLGEGKLTIVDGGKVSRRKGRPR